MLYAKKFISTDIVHICFIAHLIDFAKMTVVLLCFYINRDKMSLNSIGILIVNL